MYSPPTTSKLASAIVGCILGTAVGDALGLPYEGLTPQRRKKLFPKLGKYDFLLGKGMVSDDTEQTIMVAQALATCSGDVDEFKHSLARQLRFWLLGLPAGIGSATLRAIIRLWQGYSPDRSGINSAGNGAAMRSGIIGVCYGQNPELMMKLVLSSTKITHSNPQAEYGSIAVALAAYLSYRDGFIKPEQYYFALSNLLPRAAADFLQTIADVATSVNSGVSTPDYVLRRGWHSGVSGHVSDTVAVAIHAWLSHQQNYSQAILAAIECGGDTDTTASIVGGIVGASAGWSGIPDTWLSGLSEFPRDVVWMDRLGRNLAEAIESGKVRSPIKISPVLLVIRNSIFLMTVLLHGFRRCF
jgi:ADP-ribosyl-[dinitrogen reductase] hydrolase